ncbi:MAG: SprT-like domain-containing protein [Halobacteriota archaeon]|jgi:hypothetical protein
MQSDRQLKLAYNQYNKKFWNGELPDAVTIWEPTAKCDAICCPVFEVADGVFEIKIDPALKGEPCYWRIVLLHEMCHVAIWRQHLKHQHGRPFQEEKNCIYAMGALKNLW